MFVSVALLIWVFPAALNPEDAICPPLSDGQVDAECIHGSVYRFYVFWMGIR